MLTTGSADLVEAWGTQTLPVPLDMEVPFMRVIILPDLQGFAKSAEGVCMSFAIHELFIMNK